MQWQSQCNQVSVHRYPRIVLIISAHVNQFSVLGLVSFLLFPSLSAAQEKLLQIENCKRGLDVETAAGWTAFLNLTNVLFYTETYFQAYEKGKKAVLTIPSTLDTG